MLLTAAATTTNQRMIPMSTRMPQIKLIQPSTFPAVAGLCIRSAFPACEIASGPKMMPAKNKPMMPKMSDNCAALSASALWGE